MEFFYLWLIGIGIVIITRLAINVFVIKRKLYDNNKVVKVIINLLVSVCIILVGGITVGSCVGGYALEEPLKAEEIVMSLILPCFSVAVLTYVVGFIILGLNNLKKHYLSQILFVVIFIISVSAWSTVIWQYNESIETTTETTIESQEERELIYFCNIPVQEISGDISGSRYHISGQLSTEENLSYWYLNKKGNGIYDSASTNKSKLVFIEDEEIPYVKVIHYCSKTISINNTNHSQKLVNTKEWDEYYFYVPKSIMKYNLTAEKF